MQGKPLLMKTACAIVIVTAAFSLSLFAVLPATAYPYQFGMIETFDAMQTSTNAPQLNGTNLWSVTAEKVESASKLKTVAPSIFSFLKRVVGYNAGSGTNRVLALFVDGTATTNSYFTTRFVNMTGNTLTNLELYYDLECCWIHLAHGAHQSGKLTASISTNGTNWVALTNLNGSVSSSNATISAAWLTDDQMDAQKLSRRNIGGIIPLPAALPSIQAGQGFYIRWTVDSGSKDMVYGIDDLRAGPKDSDRDGMPDTWENVNGMNPTNCLDASADADSDGLANLLEYQSGTNPKLADSDADGMPDGWEVANSFNPLINNASADADSDDLTNIQEYQNGTNPKLADSDADGQSDSEEIDKGTNPLDSTSFTIVLTSGASPSSDLDDHIVKWPKTEGKFYTLLFSESVTGTFTPVPGCVRLTKPAGLDQGCSHVTTSETGFYKVLVETN